MAALKYWLWLANLPGVGNIVKLALLDRFEEPDAVFYADREAYLHTEGITQEIADALAAQHAITIPNTKLVLDEPIKSCGSYQIKAKLGYEVSGMVNVLVVEG